MNEARYGFGGNAPPTPPGKYFFMKMLVYVEVHKKYPYEPTHYFRPT